MDNTFKADADVVLLLSPFAQSLRLELASVGCGKALESSKGCMSSMHQVNSSISFMLCKDQHSFMRFVEAFLFISSMTSQIIRKNRDI